MRRWYLSGAATGKGSPGRFLFANTSGAGGGVHMYRIKGTVLQAPERAFYLKKELLSRLVVENCLLSQLQG